MRNYDDHRDDAGRRQSRQSTEGRDIGPVPPIVSPERRASCRLDLRRFCETYAAAAFPLAWSRDHLKVIARIEEAVLDGALYALAMPRGSGKTTIARMAALWALSYAHRRYVFVIGANHGKAEDSVDAVQVCVRFLAPTARTSRRSAIPPSSWAASPTGRAASCAGAARP